MKNLTLHIVKKDLRHLWPWLVLWWATFVLAAIYPVWAFDRLLHSSASDTFGDSFILLSSLSCIILLLVIVALLAEADTPLDDRSFWRTQPVAPARLLVAKFLFLIAFGLVVPLLIKIITLSAYGFSWEEGWPAFQNFALILIYGLVVLFLAASFFPRPLVGYAVLIGLFLLTLFIVNTAPNDIVNNFPASSKDIWVLLSLFLAILTASVSCLYLRQRRRLAILVLVLGLVLDYALGLFWPAGAPTSQPLLPPTFPSTFPLTVKFVPLPNITGLDELTSLDANATPLICGNLRADSFPAQPAEVWSPIKSHWTISWPDHPASSGTVGLNHDMQANQSDFPAKGYPYGFAEALHAFGVNHLLTTIVYNPEDFALVSPENLQRLRQSPARLDGYLTFAVYRLEDVTRLPLLPGAISRRGPVTIGLSSLGQVSDPQQVVLTVAERIPAGQDTHEISSLADEEINLLINLKRGEAVLGGQINHVDLSILSDFHLENTSFLFRFQYAAGQGKSYNMSRDEIRAWLADAQFVRLRFVPVGRARGAFSLNPLVIPPNTP